LISDTWLVLDAYPARLVPKVGEERQATSAEILFVARKVPARVWIEERAQDEAGIFFGWGVVDFRNEGATS